MSEWVREREIPSCDTCCKRMTTWTSRVPHFIMNNRLVILYFVAIAFCGAYLLPFVLKNHCYLFHIAEPLDLLNKIPSVHRWYVCMCVCFGLRWFFLLFPNGEIGWYCGEAAMKTQTESTMHGIDNALWCCHCCVTFVPLTRWQSFNILIVIWFLLWCDQ